MEKIVLNETLSLSRLIYGMWRLGDDNDTSPAHVQAKIEACLAQGITTMDQADIYGGYQAEEIFGHALLAAPHLREQVEIVTKCDIVAPAGRHSAARLKYYDTSAAHIRQSVEDSLRLMRIETIDLLLIHRPDPFMDHHETGSILDQLISSGKVKAVGVSNFKPHDWTLLQSAMENQLVTNQIEISVLANQAFINGDIAFLQERASHQWPGHLLLADVICRGNPNLIATLQAKADDAGVDIGAVAVGWLLAHPAKILPVLGTNNLERISHISDALKLDMDRTDWFEIYESANGTEVP
ncbi:MAG: aryl-alcohol dehydrogenase [Alphaproteobacteria bacterium]|nr:MAG: aryl-alcohol dehydrogenase [Alphaproteobacteria bacterium]